MLIELRKKLERRKGEKGLVTSQIREVRFSLRDLKVDLTKYEQGREVIRTVGLLTQQSLQFHISDITSLAIQAVFPDDPYILKVEFVERRNKTECDLTFMRDGKEMDPLESSGYGAVDIASLALRVASHSMKTPNSRNTIILDEPMRFLSEDRQPAASRMIKELSEKLGIQFIIVTHEESLTECADAVFNVSIKNKISSVIKIKNESNHDKD